MTRLLLGCWSSALLRHWSDVFQTLIQLHCHGLTSNGENFEGVFMHTQLCVGDLHAAYQFLQIIRKVVEVVALTFEGEHWIFCWRCGHWLD